jgi:hypothetical protein
MRRALLVILSLVIAPALQATVLVPAEFREIVTGSQVIVHGRVADVRSEQTGDRRRIETIVTLQAGTYYKGGPGDRVTFRVPGGTIGRYRSLMVGAPEFRAGDEVVLFLKANGPAVAHVFGLNQGVFRVQRDARTGQSLVVPPALMSQGDAPQKVIRGTADRKPVPLDAFGAQVRAALGAGGGR